MKNHLSILAAVVAGFFALISCVKEEPTLSVGPGSLSFESTGGVQTVNVSANNAWTASVNDAAFTISPSSGNGNSQITVTAAPNSSYDDLSGKITVTSGGLSKTVSLTQKAKHVLDLSGGEINVPAKGGSYVVDFSFNVGYTVTVDPEAQSWISLVRTRALEKGQLEFFFQPNSSTERRKGLVNVKPDDPAVAPVGIIVWQDADGQDKMANYARDLAVLKDIYETMGGADWTYRGSSEKWVLSDDINELRCKDVSWTENLEISYLNLENFGLKGQLPESIGNLKGLTELYLDDKGITGSLPESMKNLTKLNYIRIKNTSMTSLTDIFSEKMTNLEWVEIYGNEEMTGKIPEGLASLPASKVIDLTCNAFTGTPPASLAPKHVRMQLNCLSGELPAEYFKEFEAYDRVVSQRDGYGFDLSGYDLAGGYPLEAIPDIMGGKEIDFNKIISDNNYTVYLFWAPWCPFSKSLMPNLVNFYNKYHQDGLEIVATVSISDKLSPFGNEKWEDREGQIKEIEEMGYGLWYNFFYNDYERIDLELNPYDSRCWYFASTPMAEVYDSKGNIVFSGKLLNDPVRDRFSKYASTDLLPFLESKFGPLVEDDDYESKDYSEDRKVLTLQKATVGKGIDIVFMGDAYTDKDMKAGGLYETVMTQAMEEFFAIEPYKSLRDRFNVYAVKAVSKNGRVGKGYTTAFGSEYGEGVVVNANTEKIMEYASEAVSHTDNILVSLLINSVNHSGTNIMMADKQSSIAYVSTYGNDHKYFGSTLRHEAGGHGFGFLADEYVQNHGMTIPADAVNIYNEAWNKYGWYANVDFTSDQKKVKWADLIATGLCGSELGVYEGAATYEKGAFRPSQNSMMNENMEYFNAPSRRAIYKRIMELSGEGYSFEKFLEFDSKH